MYTSNYKKSDKFTMGTKWMRLILIWISVHICVGKCFSMTDDFLAWFQNYQKPIKLENVIGRRILSFKFIKLVDCYWFISMMQFKLKFLYHFAQVRNDKAYCWLSGFNKKLFIFENWYYAFWTLSNITKIVYAFGLFRYLVVSLFLVP